MNELLWAPLLMKGVSTESVSNRAPTSADYLSKMRGMVMLHS